MKSAPMSNRAEVSRYLEDPSWAYRRARYLGAFVVCTVLIVPDFIFLLFPDEMVFECTSAFTAVQVEPSSESESEKCAGEWTCSFWLMVDGVDEKLMDPEVEEKVVGPGF